MSKKTPDKMSPTEHAKKLRENLIKLMPGYNWTIKKPFSDTHMTALGIQSSGFNRISTVLVHWYGSRKWASYEAKISGYGLRVTWTAESAGNTLAQVFRNLQNYCEAKAAEFGSTAKHLKTARSEVKP